MITKKERAAILRLSTRYAQASVARKSTGLAYLDDLCEIETEYRNSRIALEHYLTKITDQSTVSTNTQ